VPYLGTQVAVPEKAEAAPLALPSSEVSDAPQTGGNNNPFAGLFSGAPRAAGRAWLPLFGGLAGPGARHALDAPCA